ncbi:SMI1/KNR4 family protein [Kitasatospora sp. NPDC094011]|uniref:SMI1/KNR4 family protein n=1 Tax=Kitasatospora sp. NPDC094011 TaxID=3364090 RepID=UPI0037FD0662
MVHPDVARLSALFGEFDGPGDGVGREALERAAGLRLSADYRDFVTLYGGGELDGYLGVSAPPVGGSPYGVLLDAPDFGPRRVPAAVTPAT